MRIAIVKGNTVDTIVDEPSIESMTLRFPLPSGWEYIDGTGLNERDVRDGPGLPWHAPAQFNSGSRSITVRAFLNRLSTSEWDAINRKIPTDAVLYRLKDKVLAGDPDNPGFINLNSSELSAGLDYLVSLNLLTLERKATLLG